ncbi:MAG: hypothetical protein WC356_03780 [Candidatus Micrarchaeia archaeon]
MVDSVYITGKYHSASNTYPSVGWIEISVSMDLLETLKGHAYRIVDVIGLDKCNNSAESFDLENNHDNGKAIEIKLEVMDNDR